MKANLKALKTVSEYIALGGMALGMLVESPVKETEKSLGFKAEKFNSYGNAYDAIAWLPKSQLIEVDNDYYPNGPAKMHICPSWLWEKNFA